MNKNNDQPSNQEILTVINDFSTQVEKRFNGLESRMETREKEIKIIKSTMVTKDYLDDKITDLRGDLVVMMRKEDTKLKALINVLHKKKIISEDDREKILSLEPFAKIA